MIAELRALRERVAALGIDAHIGQVPTGTAAPFASVSAPPHATASPTVAGGPFGVIDSDQVRVRVTDQTASNVSIRLGIIRNALCPGEQVGTLTVDGRAVSIVWVRSEGAPIIDRDVTLPTTNTHPATGVDTYRIVSQPTA